MIDFIKIYEKHCKLIALKYNLGNLVTGHKRGYFEEAALEAMNEIYKNKVIVSSYKQTGRNKEHYEPIISNEYQTEHKNMDGSILKISVKSI